MTVKTNCFIIFTDTKNVKQYPLVYIQFPFFETSPLISTQYKSVKKKNPVNKYHLGEAIFFSLPFPYICNSTQYWYHTAGEGITYTNPFHIKELPLLVAVMLGQ